MEDTFKSGKIYKLVCNDGCYYISSTTQSLNVRLNNHKRLSATSKDSLYIYLNSIGWDNIKIELIEEYPCKNKKELLAKEKQYVSQSKKDKLCLNHKDTNMYSTGKIYKLICNDEYYYIGSTTQKLYVRLNHHKYSSKSENNKLYNYINSIGWNNVRIELLEDFPCNNKQGLNEREQYYINNTNGDILCLNNEFEEDDDYESIDDDESSCNESIVDDCIQDDTLECNSVYSDSTDDALEIDSKYQDGKIYKLVCKDGHYYIGSTILDLEKRFSSHKTNIRKMTVGGNYIYFSSIPISDINIELVEYYPCNSKTELRKREDYYITQSLSDNNCLNTCRAFQTDEEKIIYDRIYHILHRDKDKETMKQYYENNKENIIKTHREYVEKNKVMVDAYHATYRLENAEKRREYTRQYVSEHPEQVKESRKRYLTENKEKVAEYWREYRSRDENKEKLRIIRQKSAQKVKELNAETIAKEQEEKKKQREEKAKVRLEYENTIVQCECGGTYQNYRKKRHDENKKHQTYLSSLST